MVGLATSCDERKLRAIIGLCYRTLQSFHHITPSEKEEIVLLVMERFERDGGKFSINTYGNIYCRNKALSLIRYKTAEKRMGRIFVDGKVSLQSDYSLNYLHDGHDEELEQIDALIAQDTTNQVSEWICSIRQVAPELLPLLEKALSGDKLTKKERKLLYDVIHSNNML